MSTKHRHRYTASRREDAAWILDVCASSRRDPFEWEGAGPLFTGHVSPTDLSFLLDLHWRSVKLAGTALYATIYDPHRERGLGWAEMLAEAAQRLREGWQLTGNEHCAEWAYE